MKTEKGSATRREALKKIGVGSAFIAPTLLSINLKEAQACTSGAIDRDFKCFQYSNNDCWRNTKFFRNSNYKFEYWKNDFDFDGCVEHLRSHLHEDRNRIRQFIWNWWER